MKAQKHKKAFEDKFTEIAQKCRESGFNTLIVQVRPFCDALYKSSYFPWSHILTGTQGENLNMTHCKLCVIYAKKTI